MRRLARRMLNVVTVVSLLLCVASVALWVQSRWKPGGIYHCREWGAMTPHGLDVHHTTIALMSGRQGIVFGRDDGFDAAMAGGRLGRLRVGWGWSRMWSQPGWKDRLEHEWRLAGLGLYAGRGDENATLSAGTHRGAEIWRWRVVAFAAPHWLAAAFGAALPLVRIIRHRRRPAPGYCPACGYDLTGNISGVCPECGTANVKGNA